METVRAGKPLYLIHSMQLTQFKTTRVNLFSLTYITLQNLVNFDMVVQYTEKKITS